MNIKELLDELQMTARVYGSTLQGKIPSPEATEWQAKQDDARAAVDAAVKALQDRIAELEKQKSYVYIGQDGKAVLARDLEGRLIAAEAEIPNLKLALGMRDYFIVSKDLWGEFTSQLPTKAEFDAMKAEELKAR